MRSSKKRRGHPLLGTYEQMRARCYNPKRDSYPLYGGRGIKVCDRWSDFWLFVEDMGERPEGCTLDRKDNNGDYSPDNCKWSTHKEQASNKRESSLYVNNTSGHKNIHWRKDRGYYEVFQWNQAKRKRIGTAPTLDLAIHMRDSQ